MAKGIGLVGNFKGKVGNMVGYKLSASNTGNTQGIRVYQPIVRNPKSSAQAEQRAKLAPINATYRALKMVIDRGNEGLPYGNKSRLAWLKQAFKAQTMPWFVKGAVVNSPVLCVLSKGSLPGLNFTPSDNIMEITASNVTAETVIDDQGNLSTALMGAYPYLKKGDQVTFIATFGDANALSASVISIIIDPDGADAISGFSAGAGFIGLNFGRETNGMAIIVSREGTNGEHLRSTSSLITDAEKSAAAPYDATSKAAAIESYQNAAGANSDWAEESIQ